MILAVALSTVGSIASVVAAVAALVTVWFAKQTVSEARAARSEAKTAHSSEMGEQRRLLDATKVAHEAEMAQRERAMESELVLQRLAQVGRIQELLGEIAHGASYEISNPPPDDNTGKDRWTRVTGGLARLEAAIAICQRLGGSEALKGSLAEARRMASDCRERGIPRQLVVDEATRTLNGITLMTETDPSLAVVEQTPTPSTSPTRPYPPPY